MSGLTQDVALFPISSLALFNGGSQVKCMSLNVNGLALTESSMEAMQNCG